MHIRIPDTLRYLIIIALHFFLKDKKPSRRLHSALTIKSMGFFARLFLFQKMPRGFPADFTADESVSYCVRYARANLPAN